MRCSARHSQLVVALDASTAALVATAVAPLAAGDPIRYGALAGIAAILVGVMLIAAGCLRLGVVAKLLTRPVLLGYQAGLAVVVVLSQFPRLLGLQVEHSETLTRAFEITARVDDVSVPTALLG
jgi:sulfate permease, SulP family